MLVKIVFNRYTTFIAVACFIGLIVVAAFPSKPEVPDKWYSHKFDGYGGGNLNGGNRDGSPCGQENSPYNEQFLLETLQKLLPGGEWGFIQLSRNFDAVKAQEPMAQYLLGITFDDTFKFNNLSDTQYFTVVDALGEISAAIQYVNEHRNDKCWDKHDSLLNALVWWFVDNT